MPARSISRDRVKTFGIGALALVVIVIATAFAVGGSSVDHTLKRAQFGVVKPGQTTVSHGVVPRAAVADNSATAPDTAPELQAPLVGSAGATAGSGATAGVSTGSNAGGSGTVAAGAPSRVIGDNSASGVDATRIVKTGELQLRVDKGAVQPTMTKLSQLAGANGGYVAESNTDANPTNPSGNITLRIPVGRFATVVGLVQKLGHVESLSTEAKDVTGKYVDLNARMHALQRTRSTYLSILSRATTIGATLSVQQRIDDVQQQVDELHGEIKLLASQSSYSTLQVNVDQPAVVALTKVHHKRHGLAKAWHTSIHRFTRGIDAIVAAVGPLLLALLLIALAYGVIRLGTRGIRRRSSGAPS